MKAMLNEPWRLGPPANQPPSAIDIIEMLCNGLEWNIENYPDTMNVSDQEALQQARAFLAAAPTPVEPGNPATHSVHPSPTLRQEAEPVDDARSVLAELYALVKGECPSLLNEDSGGDAGLDMRICDILAGSADGDQAKGLT